MSTLQQLYQQLREQLKDLSTWTHPQHVNTMAALMTAIFNSRDVRLSRIGENMPIEGKADREFGDVAIMHLIKQDMGWDYVLRIKSNQRIYIPGSGQPIAWHTVADLVPANPDEVATFDHIKYTQPELYLTNLVATKPPRDSGDDTGDPWIVATSLPAQAFVLDEYARRFGCDPLFSELKARGFHWEKTRLRHADRLSRLLLVLAYLTTWMVLLGNLLITSDVATTYWQPSHIKRYSLFQLGRRWLRKQLTLDVPLDLASRLSFWQFVPN